MSYRQRKILPTNQSQMKEQAKFTYYPLGKALENQRMKLVDVFKSLNLFNKIDELKQSESIFPNN